MLSASLSDSSGMPSFLARLAVSSDVGTPLTRKRPLRTRSPKAFTNACAARPEPRPICESLGTNSRARSTIVIYDLLRAGPLLVRNHVTEVGIFHLDSVTLLDELAQ